MLCTGNTQPLWSFTSLLLMKGVNDFTFDSYSFFSFFSLFFPPPAELNDPRWGCLRPHTKPGAKFKFG